MIYNEWQEQIRELERNGQPVKWEDVMKFYEKRGIEREIENGNITVLNEGVWMKIGGLGIYNFRKVKAVSDYTVYYDGTYENIYEAFQLGTLDLRFTIDKETLDLTNHQIPCHTGKKMLLEFIKRNTEPPLPTIPKGILKL